jgi:hypothetical protein
MMKMNWKKRKKLSKLAKRHGLIHGYEYKKFIREKVIIIRYYKNRNGRRYSPEFISAAFANFVKHRDQLIKDGKWRGEIDHPSDRLPGGEHWKYPVQVHVDLAQNPDVTTEARIGISPKGGVKFYGFDICKT